MFMKTSIIINEFNDKARYASKILKAKKILDSFIILHYI